jgi:hypothetical protein
LLAQVDVRCDVCTAEDLFGVQRVMRATSNAQIRRLVGAAQRPRLVVIQLEERARRAAGAGRVREGALLAVALEDRAPDRARHVGGAGRARWRRRLRLRARAGLRGRRRI